MSDKRWLRKEGRRGFVHVHPSWLFTNEAQRLFESAIIVRAEMRFASGLMQYEIYHADLQPGNAGEVVKNYYPYLDASGKLRFSDSWLMEYVEGFAYLSDEKES